MRSVRDNGLSLFFLGLFLVVLVGQAIAGHAAYNNEEILHANLLHEQPETLSLWRYVTSSSFGQAVMENWQSEYLQFVVFVMASVWLVQKGSTESKQVGQAGPESDEEQRIGPHARDDSPRWAKVRGLRLWLFSNSLLLVMGLIWLASWFGQSVTGWSEYNAEQIQHEDTPVDWAGYVTSADFWEATLQNWQSEFLAVGSMVIFSVYLRQRGSSQSKPVGAPHGATAEEG
jgi:uncharacterized protein DUF6766